MPIPLIAGKLIKKAIKKKAKSGSKPIKGGVYDKALQRSKKVNKGFQDKDSTGKNIGKDFKGAYGGK